MQNRAHPDGYGFSVSVPSRTIASAIYLALVFRDGTVQTAEDTSGITRAASLPARRSRRRNARSAARSLIVSNGC
jgi:hypothetical protein